MGRWRGHGRFELKSSWKRTQLTSPTLPPIDSCLLPLDANSSHPSTPLLQQILDAAAMHEGPFWRELSALLLSNSCLQSVQHLPSLRSSFNLLIDAPHSPDDDASLAINTAVRLLSWTLLLAHSRPVHSSIFATLAPLCDQSWRALHSGVLPPGEVVGACISAILRGEASFADDDGVCGVLIQSLVQAKAAEEAIAKAVLTACAVDVCPWMAHQVRCIGTRAQSSIGAEGGGGVQNPNFSDTGSSHQQSERFSQLIASIYLLIQKCPDGFEPVSHLTTMLLDILSAGIMSREALTTTALALCAALPSIADASSEKVVWGIANVALSRQSGTGKGTGLGTGTGNGEIERLWSRVQALGRFGKLCIYRGLVLTLSPAALIANVDSEEENSAWRILPDYILKGICESLETADDSHEIFYGIKALVLAMQRIKTIMVESDGDTHDDQVKLRNSESAQFDVEVAVSPDMYQRILEVVWRNWEDVVRETSKQAQQLFELLLDVKSFSHSSDTLLEDIARDMLALSPHRRGKYLPLAVIIDRLGALPVLQLGGCPPEETVATFISAMADNGICHRAAVMFESLFNKLYEYGGDQDNDDWMASWKGPLLKGLLDEATHENVAAYILPKALRVDNGVCLYNLLYELMAPESEKSSSLRSNPRAVTAIVAILRTAKRESLLECGISEPIRSQRNSESMPLLLSEDVLVAAATNRDYSTRISTLELVCIHPKVTVMPSSFELRVLRKILFLNLRAGGGRSRQKFVDIIAKFIQRARASGESFKIRFNRMLRRKDASVESILEDENVEAFRQLQLFLRDLGRQVLASLYPGSLYDRRFLALSILELLVARWTSPYSECAKCTRSSAMPDMCGNFAVAIAPFEFFLSASEVGIVSPDAVKLLLALCVDSWDKLREGAGNILEAFPTPLPGFETSEMVQGLLRWALSLCNSPRVRETDAGALLLRIIHKKYVRDSNWLPAFNQQSGYIEVAVPPPTPSESSQYTKKVETSVFDGSFRFMTSLVDNIDYALSYEGVDFFSRGFVHGLLLSLRNAIADAHLREELSLRNLSSAQLTSLRSLLRRIMSTLIRANEVVRSFMENPYRIGISAEEVSSLYTRSEYPANEMTLADEFEDLDLEHTMDDGRCSQSDAAPNAQLMMTICWLTMKEISLTAGTVVTEIPLSKTSEDSLMSAEDVRATGDALLNTILSIKHNGAIDKARLGFTIVVEKLLASQHEEFRTIPHSWLDCSLQRLTRPAQSKNDIVRRSAGLPFALLSLLMPECHTIHKGPSQGPVLISKAMGTLLDIAADASCEDESVRSGFQYAVPKIHAFNVLRLLFGNRDMGVAMSSYLAPAFQHCLLAMNSRVWEVRNAAQLAYASILEKMVGYKNPTLRDSAVRMTTGREFFHRFPSLYAFLLEQLSTALTFLESGKWGKGPGGLHPSLYPCLAVFSRLKPSRASLDPADSLSPIVFFPLMQRCSRLRQMAVRAMGARALAAVVTPEGLLDLTRQVMCPLLESVDRVGSNTVHGAFLMVRSLLENSLSVMLDALPGKGTELFLHLSQWLIRASKLSASRKCPLVAMEGTRIVLTLAKYAMEIGNGEEKEDVLLLLESRLLIREAMEAWSAIGEAYRVYDSAEAWCPGLRVFREEMIVLKLKMLLPGGGGGANRDGGELCAQFEQFLKDDQKTARKAALKYMATESLPSLCLEPLFEILVDYISSEKHSACLYRGLLLLLKIVDGVPRTGKYFVVSRALVDALGRMLLNSHSRVREAAIVLLGSQCKDDNAVGSERAETLLKYANLFSDPLQTPSSRLAASEALSTASNLFVLHDSGQKRQVDADFTIRTWRVLFRLLTDDDEEVREKTGESLSCAHSTFGDAVVSVVFEQSFFRLRRLLSGSPEWHAVLLEMLSPKTISPLWETSYSDDSPVAEVASNRLFNHESENQFEEPLLLIQYAAYALQAELKDMDDAAMAAMNIERVADEAIAALENLMAGINRTKGTDEKRCSPCWMASLQDGDLFTSLYASLLRACVLLSCPAVSARIVAATAPSLSSTSVALLHPLCASLAQHLISSTQLVSSDFFLISNTE